MAIGQTLDHNGTDNGAQLTGVAGLDAAVGDPADGCHVDSLLSGSAQVEMVLEQPAQQVPAPSVEIVLQLAV